jgi:hypothetical protein
VFAAAVTRVGAVVGAALAEVRRLEPLALKAGNTVTPVGPLHAVDATVMSCVAPSFEEYETTEAFAVPSTRVAEVLSTEIVLETAWVVLTPVLAVVWAAAKPPAAVTARMLRMTRFMMFALPETTLSLAPLGANLGRLVRLGKLAFLGRLRYWFHLFQAPTLRNRFHCLR